MVGRKGEQQLVLDQIMMLVLLALFVFAVLVYINDHARKQENKKTRKQGQAQISLRPRS
jgi:hypothetical protein